MDALKQSIMTTQKEKTMESTYIEEPWNVIGSYFKDQHLERLVRHQLESYNNFVTYQIIKTIEMFNPVHIASDHDYDAKSGKHSLEIYITFENFNIYRPQIHENNGAIKLMFPQEARLRNFTYASAMTVDMNIKYVIRTGADLENCQTIYKTLPKIHIGKLPIMLKSTICVLNQYKHVNSDHTGECKFDAGGYFIINGSEKTVLGQERAAENRVYCFNISKNSTKYTWMAEIKSVPDFKCISPKQINMMITSKNNGFGFPIVIQIPRIKQPMPLFVVFRAIGIISDKDICEKILLNVESRNHTMMLNALQASIIDANKWITQEDAMKSMVSHVMYTPINMDKETGAKKKVEFAQDVLGNDLFPHCQTAAQKVYFLGYMTNKLLQANFELAKGDDRDSYVNKRVDLTGTLLNNLFRNYFNKLVKDMEKQVIREINGGSWRSTEDYERIINFTNIYKIIKSTTIENGIKRALSTGDFGIKHSNSNKVGVAQVLNRLTYVSSLSHARRISTPTDKSGKLIPPRKLHNTSWGFLCPAETPEGQSVGIVKNLSYMTHISIHSESSPLREYIMPNIVDIQTLSPAELFDQVKVFINGAWVGITHEPFELYKMLKDKKHSGIINIYTSIIFDFKLKEIRVCNDGGRLMRPLFLVKDKKILLTKEIIKQLDNGDLIWDDLLTNAKLQEAIIEYVDPEEQSWSLISMKPNALSESVNGIDTRYTHCEIHPSTMFGVMASCIPFPEHNQSPRNCYQCLDVNEMVLMANGSKKRISDIKIGDEVISFNPKTMKTSSTRVSHHYIRETDKKIFKITTVSGREIIATEDHKFMTTEGWLEVANMTPKQTNIGIYSPNCQGLNEEVNTIKERKHELFDSSKITCIGDGMFIPIESIVEVENRAISDITVESDNHSFIAGNNFLSSNCAQGKQAMGIYTTNFDTRMDKTAYLLNYPTRPLVDTRIMNMIKLNDIPSGTNVIVAIMTHTGYNQEDSLLFNKGSLDRGLFVATIYHTEKDEDKQKVNGDEEIRCKPDATKTKGMKFGNYDKVNGKGVIPENTLVENRDIIIAKVTPIKENRNDHTKLIKFEDQSKIFRTAEETYVDKNYIDRNGDGYNFAKVRLRTVRKPVIGDKFSSRHGQKGTIGNIIPECDMPYTASGVRPDIIINPHAIPSRMTIGQLKETVLGKTLVSLGLFGDGTSFGEFDVKDICKELQKVGYESNGNEIMYNGLTGEQFESSVFIGPVFYQRLKHMVNDKTHSRSIGPMVNLTRQPAEGRSRDGGLRFGEMERDCFCGAAPLPLNCGLSVAIETMENCDFTVLGWSEKHNGCISAKQTGFMCKGERPCVEVTFEDGRKIVCTEDHPVLTSDNQWVKVKDLKINETKVKSSVTYPLVNIQEEMNECAGWTFTAGSLTLKTNTKENYLKTLSFARIIGLLISDGNISKNETGGRVYLGHPIDLNGFLEDLSNFCFTKQESFLSKNTYTVNIPMDFMNDILCVKGLIKGRKIDKPAQLPDFVLDPLCPRPIIREFLGGMFGGDGHTCVLGMHRGKRDILSSVSISQSKTKEHLDSLKMVLEQIQGLLKKCGIEKTTIQSSKENTSSKKKSELEDSQRKYQMLLHLDISELVNFSEKIGFRYCCHKSQRLEAGVSYKRLRNEVVRQHNWLVNRVDELTHFSEIKKENPTKIVHTKNAIQQAVEELQKKEPLMHEYAIPSTHDITDHLIKGTQFGKFTSKSFPTAEEFLEKIGALNWFIEKNAKEIVDSDEDSISDSSLTHHTCTYGVNRETLALPTMNLTVKGIILVGLKKVYDIEVEEVHSFLANGIVAHNCMISHGASRFTKERLYDVSDKYQVHICKKCGLIASYNNELHIHLCRTCGNRSDFALVKIPYACKLMTQELITMNVCSRFVTED
jgi:DNA-directed RNA polymerase beta subunit